MDICLLCQCSSKLVDSHVFPRSFLSNQDGLLIIGNDGRKQGRTSLGVCGNYLCSPCENKFSRYDEVAKSFFISNKQDLEIEYPIDSRADYVLRPLGHDRLMIARFYLTLLWRAHAHRKTAKKALDEIYAFKQYELVEAVNLGSYFEDLREVISSKDFNIPDYIDIILSYIEIPETLGALREHIPAIRRRKFDGKNAYEVSIKGIKAIILVGKGKSSHGVNFISITKSPTFRMLKMSYDSYCKTNEFKNLVDIILK